MTPWTIVPRAPLSVGILQARILEGVARPSSRGYSRPRDLALQADSLLSEPPGKQTYKLKEGKKYGERASCYYRAVNKGLIVKVILDQRPV